MSIAGIILNDQHRPYASLLTAHYRTQIGIENISSSDGTIHKGSLSAVQSHRCTGMVPAFAVTMIFPRLGGIYTHLPHLFGKWGRLPPIWATVSPHQFTQSTLRRCLRSCRSIALMITVYHSQSRFAMGNFHRHVGNWFSRTVPIPERICPLYAFRPFY